MTIFDKSYYTEYIKGIKTRWTKFIELKGDYVEILISFGSKKYLLTQWS